VRQIATPYLLPCAMVSNADSPQNPPQSKVSRSCVARIGACPSLRAGPSLFPPGVELTTRVCVAANATAGYSRRASGCARQQRRRSREATFRKDPKTGY